MLVEVVAALPEADRGCDLGGGVPVMEPADAATGGSEPDMEPPEWKPLGNGGRRAEPDSGLRMGQTTCMRAESK